MIKANYKRRDVNKRIFTKEEYIDSMGNFICTKRHSEPKERPHRFDMDWL